MLGNWLKPVQIWGNVKCWHPNDIPLNYLCTLYMFWRPKSQDLVSETHRTSRGAKNTFRTFVKSFISKILGGSGTSIKGKVVQVTGSHGQRWLLQRGGRGDRSTNSCVHCSQFHSNLQASVCDWKITKFLICDRNTDTYIHIHMYMHMAGTTGRQEAPSIGNTILLGEAKENATRDEKTALCRVMTVCKVISLFTNPLNH